MDCTQLRRLARISAKALAIIRCAIGAAALARPSVASTPWVGASESERTSIRVFGRALGGRDLALGVGLLGAASDQQLSRMSALGAGADLVDFLSTLRDFKRLPRLGRSLVLLSTLGAAALGSCAAVVLRSIPDQSDRDVKE